MQNCPFYFAILGDTSDNIPGVKGIGDKGALELVHQFSSLEDLYENLDKVSKDRMRNALLANKDNAFLSYQLFLLQYHPSGLTTQDLHLMNIIGLMRGLSLQSLILKHCLKILMQWSRLKKGSSPRLLKKWLIMNLLLL